MNFELNSCKGFGIGIEQDKIKAFETPTVCIQKDEDTKVKKVILW